MIMLDFLGRISCGKFQAFICRFITVLAPLRPISVPSSIRSPILVHSTSMSTSTITPPLLFPLSSHLPPPPPIFLLPPPTFSLLPPFFSLLPSHPRFPPSQSLSTFPVHSNLLPNLPFAQNQQQTDNWVTVPTNSTLTIHKQTVLIHPIIDQYYNHTPSYIRSSGFAVSKGLVANPSPPGERTEPTEEDREQGFTSRRGRGNENEPLVLAARNRI